MEDFFLKLAYFSGILVYRFLSFFQLSLTLVLGNIGHMNESESFFFVSGKD